MTNHTPLLRGRELREQLVACRFELRKLRNGYREILRLRDADKILALAREMLADRRSRRVTED